MYIETYENELGFGFRVFTDEGIMVADQPFDPELEGFQAMTEERAGELAAIVLNSYLTPVVPLTPEKTPDQIRIEQLEAILYKPNPNEIFLSLDVENTDLDELKQKKIEQLDYFCNTTILNGFTSDCLGVEHTYGFDMEDQSNLSGRLSLINANPTNPKLQQFNWKTKDAGVLQHTKEQFVLLCADADDHKDNWIAYFWSLKIQALSAETKNDVMLIEW